MGRHRAGSATASAAFPNGELLPQSTKSSGAAADTLGMTASGVLFSTASAAPAAAIPVAGAQWGTGALTNSGSNSRGSVRSLGASGGAAGEPPVSLLGTPVAGSPAAPAALGGAAAGKDVLNATTATTSSGSASARVGRSRWGDSTDSHRKRVLQLEAKLQLHMDGEDRRVKELTEGVLYDFLPAALAVMLPPGEDPLAELDETRCRAVAAAALAVSSLMNAPPGFLEFLLCIPWCNLPHMHPGSATYTSEPGSTSNSTSRSTGSSKTSSSSSSSNRKRSGRNGKSGGSGSAASGSGSNEQLLNQLQVDEGERRLLVNTRIHPALMAPLLDFMYQPEHADSVPLGLQLTPAAAGQMNPAQAQQPGNTSASSTTFSSSSSSAQGPPATSCTEDGISLEAVAALLDGATPLHCAAIRGNPAQVDHLLYCGADPTMRTAAGELPLHLVPVCGHRLRAHSRWACCCLAPADQEVWECRSRLARSLIARRCLSCIQIGLVPWLRLLMFCVLVLVGFLPLVNTAPAGLLRPAVQQHMANRRRQKCKEIMQQVLSLLQCMRSEAIMGQGYLSSARQLLGFGQHSGDPPESNAHPAAAAATAGAAAAEALHQHGRQQQQQRGKQQEEQHGSTHRTAAFQQQQQQQGAKEATAAPQAPGEPEQHVLIGGFGEAVCIDRMDQGWHSPCLAAAGAASGLGFGATAASPLSTDSTSTAPDGSAAAGGGAAGVQSHIHHRLLEGGKGSITWEVLGEQAFRCYVRAVHALQGLDLQSGCVPQLLLDTEDGRAGSLSQDLQVMEDEQAVLYCCWAESVLLKLQACSCPGCTALAVQAIRMAHMHVAGLYARMEKQIQRYDLVQQQHYHQQHQAQSVMEDAPRQPPLAAGGDDGDGDGGDAVLKDRWAAVAAAFGRVILTHISLLLVTDARQSATRAAVSRAEHCLKEWDRLAMAGVVGMEGLDAEQVNRLRVWAKMAESDLQLAEALYGSSLPPAHTLEAALAAATTSNATGFALLSRPVSYTFLQQLRTAQALALMPSPPVKQLAEQVAAAAQAELEAAEMLQELVRSRSLPSTPEGLASLSAAIKAAAGFPRLAAELAAAQTLYLRSSQRVQVVAQLEGVMAHTQQYMAGVGLGQPVAGISGSGGSGGGAVRSVVGYDVPTWEGLLQVLQAAIEAAKEADIHVNQAKRLVKELQAQMSAAEVIAAVDAVLLRRPCGSAALKSVLLRAESASCTVSGVASCLSSPQPAVTAAGGSSSGTGNTSSSCCGSAAFVEALVPRIQACRKRLEVEKAAELLHKATLNCKGLADLPKLEGAILNARKVGAEDLDPEVYQRASDLRVHYTEAARTRAQLDAAVKQLGKGGRTEDADAVEAALLDSSRWEELLSSDMVRARDALESWRSQTASEAKLTRALREGCSPAQLARAIQEAAAAGVKVAAAKRILKLMQALDAAVTQAAAGGSAGPAAQAVLRAKLDAAEQGGVSNLVLDPARRLLQQLQVAEARGALDAALKPHSDWSVNHRVSVLKAALEKVEEVLGCDIAEVVSEQTQQQQEQERDKREGDEGESEPSQTEEQGDSSGGESTDAGHQDAHQQQHQEQQQQQGDQLEADQSPVSALAQGKQTSTNEAPATPRAGALSLAPSVSSSGVGAVTRSSSSHSGAATCMSRAASVASSLTASEASSTLTSLSAAAASCAGLGRVAGAAGGARAGLLGGDRDAQDLLESALKAWQLLQEDQQELKRLGREKAEQERLRKEMQEKDRADRQRAGAERAEQQRSAADKREARGRAAEGKRSVKIVWADMGGAAALRTPGGKREVAAIVVPSGADAGRVAVAAAAAAATAGSGASTAAAGSAAPVAATGGVPATNWAARPGSSSGSSKAGSVKAAPAHAGSAAGGEGGKGGQQGRQQQQQVAGSYLLAACRFGEEGHPSATSGTPVKGGSAGTSSSSLEGAGALAMPALEDQLQLQNQALPDAPAYISSEGVALGVPTLPTAPLAQLKLPDQQLLSLPNDHGFAGGRHVRELPGMGAVSGPMVSGPMASPGAVYPGSQSITESKQKQQQDGALGGDLLLAAVYPPSAAAAAPREASDLISLHARTSSFDILGDVHAKLDREVLEMLGVADGPSAAAAASVGTEADGMSRGGQISSMSVLPSNGASSSKVSPQQIGGSVGGRVPSAAGNGGGGMAGIVPSSWRLSDDVLVRPASGRVLRGGLDDASNMGGSGMVRPFPRERPASSGMQEGGGSGPLGVGPGIGTSGGGIWNSALGLGGGLADLGTAAAAAAAGGAVAPRASTSSTGGGAGSAMVEVAGTTAHMQAAAAPATAASGAGGVERRYSCDGIIEEGALRYQGRLGGIGDEGEGLGLGGGRWGPLSPSSPAGALLTGAGGGGGSASRGSLSGFGVGSATGAASMGYQQQEQQLRQSFQGDGLRGSGLGAAGAGGALHNRPPLMPRLSVGGGSGGNGAHSNYASPAGAVRGGIGPEGMLTGGGHVSPTSPANMPGVLMGYTCAAGDLVLLADHHRHQLMMNGGGGGTTHHSVMHNASGNLSMGPVNGYGQVVQQQQQQQQVVVGQQGWSLGLQGRGLASRPAGTPLSPVTASAAMVLGGNGPLAGVGGGGGGYMLSQHQQQQACGMLRSPTGAGGGGVQQLCQAYLSGFCANGDRCMFVHSMPPSLQHHQNQQQHLMQQFNCYGALGGAGGPRTSNQDLSGSLLGPLTGSFRSGTLADLGGLHGSGGGFAAAAEPSPRAAAAVAAAAVSAATVTGMGAYSSFAFGAPGSSAFSSQGFVGEAGVRGRTGSGSGGGVNSSSNSSLCGTNVRDSAGQGVSAVDGGGMARGVHGGTAERVVAGEAGSGKEAAPVSAAVAGLPNLPEDLSFSPPSYSPAGQLLPSHLF